MISDPTRAAWKLACGTMLLTCLAGAPALAETVLRFSPADPLVELGSTASLAVHVDEPLEIRTVELFVRYDPEILTSTGGNHGQCFTESGAFIFEDWEETEPGSWHGYAIVMDALHWAVGPGELYVWSFTADACGSSPVTVETVRLYDPDAQLIADVSLAGVTVEVNDPTGAGASPPAVPALAQNAPNPFNPSTRIAFDLPSEQAVRLSIYAPDGRLVRELLNETRRPGRHEVTWEGRDDAGRPLASGTYVSRLQAGATVATRKLSLVR